MTGWRDFSSSLKKVSNCRVDAVAAGPSDGLILIGYHGTNERGFQAISRDGVKPEARTRTGAVAPQRESVFYVTDRWESALSYAQSPGHILEIRCSDVAAVGHDAFRRNLQGITELKIRSGFECLVAAPASDSRHPPTSFHALGFRGPAPWPGTGG